MSDILDKITAYKREEVAHAKDANPLQVMAEYARSAPRVRPFAQAIADRLANSGTALIAEIKKASPSKGSSAPTSILPHWPRPTKQAGQRACRSLPIRRRSKEHPNTCRPRERLCRYPCCARIL